MHSRSFLAREFNPNLTLSRCQEPRPWKERFFLDPIQRDTHSPNKVSTGTCIESRPIKARNWCVRYCITNVNFAAWVNVVEPELKFPVTVTV
jgi:hypothetical protein